MKFCGRLLSILRVSRDYLTEEPETDVATYEHTRITRSLGET